MKIPYFKFILKLFLLVFGCEKPIWESRNHGKFFTTLVVTMTGVFFPQNK